jgi:hypothetical protein
VKRAISSLSAPVAWRAAVNIDHGGVINKETLATRRGSVENELKSRRCYGDVAFNKAISDSPIGNGALQYVSLFTLRTQPRIGATGLGCRIARS